MQLFLTETEWEDINAALERDYDPEEFPLMRALLEMESPFAEA